MALLALASCAGSPVSNGSRPKERPLDPVAPAAVAPPALAPAASPTAATPPEPGPCTEGMALVDGRFCIDRFEASVLGEDGRDHSPYRSVAAERVRAVSREGAVPQAYISMEEADAACRRSEKRLCSTAEWVEACAGGGRVKRAFPYGNRLRLGVCNVERGGHPQLIVQGGRRRPDAVAMNDPRINQLGATVAPSGAFADCASPEGVHDLVGNLLEWTRGSRPLLMGGHYVDSSVNGEGCRYVTQRHDAQYHDYTTGFRCCSPPVRGPEPATVVAAYRPKDEATPSPGSAAVAAPRDPPGVRAFDRPAVKLPPARAVPRYEPEGAACPIDMALVDGQRCSNPLQECLRWVDDPGFPARSCGEFARPTTCAGPRLALRYCIDRYEYTPSGWELPLVHVSWGEADNLCRAEDKRLCHEEEWEFACEGPEALPYPYGYERDAAACNHDRSELFTARQKLIDRRVSTTSLPRCASPFGVFSLVGNVDEWTTRASEKAPHRSILRGGWWLKGRNRCRAATSSHDETYAGPQTSFRCCKAARP